MFELLLAYMYYVYVEFHLVAGKLHPASLFQCDLSPVVVIMVYILYIFDLEVLI